MLVKRNKNAMPIISNQTLSSLDVAKLAQFFLICKSFNEILPPPATKIPKLHQSDQINLKFLPYDDKTGIQRAKNRPQKDSPSLKDHLGCPSLL